MKNLKKFSEELIEILGEGLDENDKIEVNFPENTNELFIICERDENEGGNGEIISQNYYTIHKRNDGNSFFVQEEYNCDEYQEWTVEQYSLPSLEEVEIYLGNSIDHKEISKFEYYYD